MTNQKREIAELLRIIEEGGPELLQLVQQVHDLKMGQIRHMIESSRQTARDLQDPLWTYAPDLEKGLALKKQVMEFNALFHREQLLSQAVTMAAAGLMQFQIEIAQQQQGETPKH